MLPAPLQLAEEGEEGEPAAAPLDWAGLEAGAARLEAKLQEWR